MRLTRIEFNGYKRLAQTSCNVDGKLIAFVGPNEAGKTSVLEALAWLDAPDGTPLPGGVPTRDLELPEHEPVVTATYRVDEKDHRALSMFNVTVPPLVYRVSKFVDGRVQAEASPTARWSAKLFEKTATRLRAALPQASRVIDRLGLGPAHQWSKAEIHELATTSKLLPPDDVTASFLVMLLGAGTGHDMALRFLHDNRPAFRLFTAADRVLLPSYDLSDDQVRSSPPAALDNLLAMAGLSVESLLREMAKNDDANLQTELKWANEAIQQAIQARWRQSALTVRLTLGGSTVRIFIDELTPTGKVTSFDERSDGLRTFVALAGFLHSPDSPSDAILLIDEAETHLHLDAQADLIEMLHRQDVAGQVLYTTHSPGCLPPDLGTGVRFVAPSATNPGTSELHNNFWTNEGPGFSSLLFRMGASAAAFSACRHAVIAEGPTEMILLPTLIKLATGEPHLTYQVAPGLANAPADDPQLGEVAARTAYLVDGDKGGATKKAQLEAAGVPADHVLALPTGQAIEDLLTADSHLGAINAHFAECGIPNRVSAADLDAGKTRGKAVSDWCKAHRIGAPGKTVIASRLVDNPDQIELEPGAVTFLKELHAKLTEILKL